MASILWVVASLCAGVLTTIFWLFIKGYWFIKSNAAARHNGCAVEINGRPFLFVSLVSSLVIWLAIRAVQLWLQ
jgi:hypothetical protein